MLFQFGFYWVVAAIIIGSAIDHRVDQSLDVIVIMKTAARNANANNPDPENNNVAPGNLPVVPVVVVDNNVAPGNLPVAPVIAVDNNVAPGNLPIAPVVAVEMV
ncbi:hypothetical protein LWI29_028883 [Acer saccharum]|uniref:Uncharacterized protein n=1 Tax=Acer saccharum TaxID=4024 RepID=A0AA39VZ72_ACESA|nr:hypothetical protein LWI29_028883 [Acer saccharum]